jgi:hypothetical protein
MIAKAATGLQRQWDNTPTLTIRGDHLDPNTDLGKATAIVQSLDLGWKTPMAHPHSRCLRRISAEWRQTNPHETNQRAHPPS